MESRSTRARTLVAIFVLGGVCACSPTDESETDVAKKRVGDTAATLPILDSLETQLERGIEVYQRGEYDSARAVLQPALADAEVQSDSAVAARIVTVLGLTAYRLGDYGEARRLGEEALSLKRRIGLTEELWRSYNALGLLAWRQSRLSEAAGFYDRAAESAVVSEDSSHLAVISINRGLVHTDLGNFDEARAAFNRARSVSHAYADARLEGISLNNLGMLGIWIGDPVEATAFLSQARSHYGVVDFVPGELNALGQLGTAYTAMGQIGKAIATLDSALELSRVRGMRHEEASNLEALAEAYRVAGHHRRALALYEEAEKINAEVGLVQETGSDQRSRAEIYEALGEIELARTFASRALDTHRMVEARWEQLADLVLLADLAHQAGDSAAAGTFLQEAHKIAVLSEARTARLDVALAEARIADRARQSRRVLGVLGAVRADLIAGGYDAEWEAETLRARAFLRLEEFDSAVTAGRRAVRAVERVRGGLGSGILRTAYAANRQDAYASLVFALLARGETAAAFQVADAARGRAMLEHLSAAELRESDGTGAAVGFRKGEEILRRIHELGLRIQEFDTIPPGERDSSILHDYVDRLSRARGEYTALRVRAIDRDSAGAMLLGGTSAGTAEVQAALRDDEAIVEYFVTADRLVGFVVTPDSVSSFQRQISDANLARRVRIVRDLIADPESDPKATTAPLENLHELLFAATTKSLPRIRHLVVIPHAVLNYVPFAALIDGTTERYLSELYTLQVLPSAAALPVLRNRGLVVSVERARPIAFAPLPGSLPATRDEARAFSRALPGGRAVVGNDATEARVRQALRESSIVHVGTHGVMNPHSPMFSRIELAARDADSANDDGFLAVHEILDLAIRSQLVFLSGCETAVGPGWSTHFAQGEDYATLARAFLYAGARDVIATLWRVEDKSAAEFARLFYEQLADSDPVEALARAQRAMLSQPGYASPYYWASYQLAGAGRTVAPAQDSPGSSVK